LSVTSRFLGLVDSVGYASAAILGGYFGNPSDAGHKPGAVSNLCDIPLKTAISDD